MQTVHTAETGHELIVCLEGNEWDGFCFNCATDYIFKEISEGTKIDEEAVKLLINCMEGLELHYNLEPIDNLVMTELFSSVVSGSVVSPAYLVDTLWTAVCVPLLVPRLAESKKSFSTLISHAARLDHLSSVELSWLKGIQLKLIRTSVQNSKYPSALWKEDQDIFDCNKLLLSTLGQYQLSIGRANLDIGEIFGRMEVAYFVSFIMGMSGKLSVGHVPIQASKVLEILLIELGADYTALLNAQDQLSVLADLSVPRYRQSLFCIITALIQRARESAAETDTILAYLVPHRSSQQYHRQVLVQMAQCALSLCSAVQHNNTSTISIGVGAEGNVLVGLQCIYALLVLADRQKHATVASAEIASRLLAEDCNFGTKLFALLELQQVGLQQTAGTHLLASCSNNNTEAAGALEQVATATFLQLARACPARYFHYSLFTPSVRGSLCRRYERSVRSLMAVASRTEESLLPVLGEPRAENTVNRASAADNSVSPTSPLSHYQQQQRASSLQSLLILALQQGACPAPAVLSMLQTCAELLQSVPVDVNVNVRNGSSNVAGVLGLLAHCLPLLHALLLLRCDAGGKASYDTDIRMHSKGKEESLLMPTAAGFTVDECVLHACRLLANVVLPAVSPLLSLRADFAAELHVSLIACLQCVYVWLERGAAEGIEGAEGGKDGGAFTYDCLINDLAQQVSYAVNRELFTLSAANNNMLAATTATTYNGNENGDEVFLCLVAVLSQPPLHPLHRRAFDSRLLHAHLARYCLSKCALLSVAASATASQAQTQTQSQTDALLNAYAAFLSCTGDVSSSEAVRVCLEVAVRTIGSDVDRPQQLLQWSHFEAAHVARLLVALIGTPAITSQIGNYVCFYLACCLDSSGAALAHLSHPPSTLNAPVDYNGSSSDRSGRIELQLLVQGLALLQNPRQVCATYPEALGWLLSVDSYRPTALQLLLASPALSSDQYTVLLTYCVLLSSSSGVTEKESEVDAACEKLLWLLPMLTHPSNKDGEGDGDIEAETSLFVYWDSCSSIASHSDDPNAILPIPTTAVGAQGSGPLRESMLALLLPLTARLVVKHPSEEKGSIKSEQAATLVRAVQALVLRGFSSLTPAGVTAFAEAVDAAAAKFVDAAAFTQLVGSQEEALLWTFVLQVLRRIVVVAAAALRTTQTDEAAEAKGASGALLCEDLCVRVLERAGPRCAAPAYLTALLTSTWETAYCCIFLQGYEHRNHRVLANQSRADGNEAEAGAERELNTCERVVAHALAALKGTCQLKQFRARLRRNDFERWEQFRWPDQSIDSILCYLYSIAAEAVTLYTSHSFSAVAPFSSFSTFSTLSTSSNKTVMALLQLSESSRLFLTQCVEGILVQGPAAATVRHGLRAVQCSNIGTGTEGAPKLESQTELVDCLHVCSLSCLAAALLRLSRPPALRVNGDHPSSTTSAAAAAAAGSVDVVLRCALLRAQELLLECGSSLFHLAGGNSKRSSSNRVVKSVRELQRCAALFCSTCCALDLDKALSTAGAEQQAWHSLWAAQLPPSPPIATTALTGGTLAAAAANAAPVAVTAVYALPADPEYSQHCHRVWSTHTFATTTNTTTAPTIATTTVQRSTNCFDQQTQVAAGLTLVLVLERAVAVHTLQLSTMVKEEL